MNERIAAKPVLAAPVYVGCAGWSLPGAVHARFPRGGTHLQRYASVFPAVEINTCFYRPHRPSTYARWRDDVPGKFRFAAKVPKAITHEAGLRNAHAALEKFLGEAGQLQHKLGCLLVQLPPSLRFDAPVVQQFFRVLRTLTETPVVCEPRHRSWFGQHAAGLLAELDVPYVRADPRIASIPETASTANIANVEYIRLHGSPVMYESSYSDDVLRSLAVEMEGKSRQGRQVWCIFDNTLSGSHVDQALYLLQLLERAGCAA